MIRPLLAHARRSWRSPLLLPLALFLVSLAVALQNGLKGTEGVFLYALDDAYIHMAVAKNFATHGVWGCTPWHFSSSSSSLLWTFGLGLAYVVLQVRDWIPFVVNVVLAVGTLVVAERSLSRLGVAPVVRATTLLGIVVAFPMVGMVLMGMEHVAHLLLTIAFAGLAVGVLGGGLFQILFQLPFFRRIGYDLTPSFKFRDPNFQKILKGWLKWVNVIRIDQPING